MSCEIKLGKKKEYSRRDFDKLLKSNGFEPVRCAGDHTIYKRYNEVLMKKETVSVPLSLNIMLTRRLIKEFNLF